MNSSSVFDSKITQQKYYNDNNLNFSDPSKMWFYIPYDRWFLGKDEKQPMQGHSSWFDSATKIIREINKPRKGNKIDASQVEVRLTNDPALLRQYYDLREKIYQNDSGYVNYSGAENNYDKNGRIFLGIFNNMVVAGARLVVSSDVDHLPHENEKEGFMYPEICKTVGIDLDGVVYSEVSALVIRKEFRMNLINKLLKSMADYCKANDIKYMIGVANMKCNRDYRISLAKDGIKSVIIDKVIAPRKPEFNNIDSFPIISFTH